MGTMDALKKKIRPMYEELKGYLSQIPLPKDSDSFISNSVIFDQFNKTIDELNTCSGKNYDKFRIFPCYEEANYRTFSLIDYRQKLGGLILRLHAEYFPDEPKPFGGSPSMVINQNQQQNQNVNLQMLLKVQGLIDKKLLREKEHSTKRKFLQKIKKSLPDVKDVIELIRLILPAANDIGLKITEIAEIFQ